MKIKGFKGFDKDMKKKKVSRWPDFELIDLKGTVTFGTNIYMRKDKMAIRILFPAGESILFAPMDEIEGLPTENYN